MKVVVTLFILLFGIIQVKADIILEYEVLVKKEHPLIDQPSVLPQKLFLYINESRAVLKHVGYNLQNTKVVFDLKDDLAYHCIIDRGIKTRIEYANIDFKIDSSTTYNISGFACRKATGFSQLSKVTIYFADPYGVHFSEFGALPGLPMLYVFENKHFGEVMYKVTNVKVGNAPSGTFDMEAYEFVQDKEVHHEHAHTDWTGKPAPEINIRTLKNGKREIHQWKDKITVINFWFTKCSPCIKEMPLLNKLQHIYQQDERVDFLAITYNNKVEIKELLRRYDFDYEIIPYADDVIESFEISAYPTHMLVGPDGRVVHQSIGNNPYIAYDLSKLIDSLLADM